ncbi:hypothetical protein [Halovulum sp. GXIMD14793]
MRSQKAKLILFFSTISFGLPVFVWLESAKIISWLRTYLPPYHCDYGPDIIASIGGKIFYTGAFIWFYPALALLIASVIVAIILETYVRSTTPSGKAL